MSTQLDINQAYQTLCSINQPNPMQQAVWDALLTGDKGGLLILAPTGSGKTEAVSIPSLATGKRLVFVLPARSLVDDQAERFEKLLQQASAYNTTRPFSLIVDTGATSQRIIWLSGKKSPAIQHRHLYNGDVILTTLDKFIYRFFGFGEQHKSYIYPLRIHFGLREALFCFDEAHVYDEAGWSNFCLLVRALYEKGLDVIAMSATMPDSFIRDLPFLELLDWMHGNNREALNRFNRRGRPERSFMYFAEPKESLNSKVVALCREHSLPTRRIIVTLERVDDAVQAYDMLKGEKVPNLILYHGRLNPVKRLENYRKLKKKEKNNEGYVLVTTSAIEVGCDLNAHVLISQTTNPEQILQRAGRCNRTGDLEGAKVIIVGNDIPSYIKALPESNCKEFIKTLWEMHNKNFVPENIQKHISKTPQHDYRSEILFKMLYEYVYEAETINKGLHEKGLVITRSWEPSVTYVLDSINRVFQ